MFVSCIYLRNVAFSSGAGDPIKRFMNRISRCIHQAFFLCCFIISFPNQQHIKALFTVNCVIISFIRMLTVWRRISVLDPPLKKSLFGFRKKNTTIRLWQLLQKGSCWILSLCWTFFCLSKKKTLRNVSSDFDSRLFVLDLCRCCRCFTVSNIITAWIAHFSLYSFRFFCFTFLCFFNMWTYFLYLYIYIFFFLHNSRGLIICSIANCSRLLVSFYCLTNNQLQ